MSEGSLYDAALVPPVSDYPHLEIPEEEESLAEDEVALLYVGHLSGSVTLGNRVIRIRTLKIGEELEAALLAERWRNTAEASRALVVAYVAAAITSVDGKPLVQILGPTENELEMKFQFILENWYWQPTIRTVYEEYNSLVKRLVEAIETTKKG